MKVFTILIFFVISLVAEDKYRHGMTNGERIAENIGSSGFFLLTTFIIITIFMFVLTGLKHDFDRYN